MRRAHLQTWLDTTDASHPARCVYQCLWLHSDAAGNAWPSVARIGAQEKLGRSTVQRALCELTERGDVIPKTSAGRVTAYYLPAASSYPHLPHSGAPNPTYNPPRNGAGGPQIRDEPAPQRGPKRFKRSGSGGARSHSAPATTPSNGVAGAITDDRGTFLPGTGWIR